MGKKPKRLHVSIGGYMGPSYSVQLVRGKLQYKSCQQACTNRKMETIPVTNEQWKTFREALDSLDIWQWEKEYPNSGVCDGTSWDLDITYADRKIRSHGDNNYPAEDASESVELTEGNVFNCFIAAVRSLVGDRDFR